MAGKDDVRHQCEAANGNSIVLLNSQGYIPVFPSGFCVSVKTPRNKGELFITLRFIATENNMDIPISTVVLTLDEAKGLVSLLNKAIDEAKVSGKKRKSASRSAESGK